MVFSGSESIIININGSITFGIGKISTPTRNGAFCILNYLSLLLRFRILFVLCIVCVLISLGIMWIGL